jgi:CheY-like chemotaxis protein
MDTQQKILLLDDDVDLLETYGEILAQLPSRPIVHKASAGARALAMLESEPYHLLISDLKMPKMDGLQVLSMVRRKYPHLRTVVLTSLVDEQFRSRVYALGVDLFWQKPGTEQEIKQFLECIESLLGREGGGGFRGVQSKSLVDIIQLECISHSSSVLRITNGVYMGWIWINEGELIDAETEDAIGEAAFHKILSWKAGNFETLPADRDRERRILQSYNALLLETAQAQDEANQENLAWVATHNPGISEQLAPLARYEGVAFIVALNGAEADKFESHGIEAAEKVAAWTRKSLARFRPYADRLQAGPLEMVEAVNHERRIVLTEHSNSEFCVGWNRSVTAENLIPRMKKLLALWVS